MKSAARFLVFLALVVTTSFSAGGCGGTDEPRVKVAGTLTNNGKPVATPGVGSQIEMRFWPQGEGTLDSQGATVQPDGSFVVPGNENEGIAPGKYKIEVRQWIALGEDGLKGRFSQDNTPIEREILQDTTDLNIDLAEFKK